MKNPTTLALVALLALSIITGLILLLTTSTPSENNNLEITEFSLNECLDAYAWEIRNSHCDGSYDNWGQITDASSAIKTAQQLWHDEIDTLPIYSGDYALVYQDEVSVSFDDIESCWHVQEILPSDVDGVVRHALIRSNGDVIAVWVG